MAALSSFLENQIIDWLFRGQSANIAGVTVDAATTNTYMGLFLTVPSVGISGVEVPVANNYSRVAIVSNTTNWSSTSGDGTTGASTGNTGTISNNIPITFGTPTGDWGTVNGVGIFNSSINGEVLLCGNLSTPKTVSNGSPAQIFSPGSLILKLDQ